MPPVITHKIAYLRSALQRWSLGPHMLAFIPALSLAGYWLGGELALLGVALTLPLVYGLVCSTEAAQRHPARRRLGQDLVSMAAAQDFAQHSFEQARAAEMHTACLLFEAEGIETISRRMGEDVAETLRVLLLRRLRQALRPEDTAMRIGDSRFMVLIAPGLRLDLEALIALSDRLQRILEEPAVTDSGLHYLSVAIGFCGSARLRPGADGADMLDCAQAALREASDNAPSAIRAWSEGMRSERRARTELLTEVEAALAKGQIQPWYQPQLCTSTGEISGVEALVRWIHPQRGIIPPAQFLEALHESGRMDQLTETVLHHGLTALRDWDAQGVSIPRLSINFSDVELRNPRLVDRLKWDLDRFGLPPTRLGIEVLETVIAESPEGIIPRNIMELSRLGCRIDLDDFGTGHASIATLRRLTVHRLKIDRSFVARVDRSEDQRRMMAAVLGLADRLGLETVAEGVESSGEHTLLAQLGCDHAQGFGIARPMPAAQLADWAIAHTERIAAAQKLGRGPA
ncbi:GGDEF domain-containing phosphodiesterase [Alloyangia pacifica]|uniref:bifunctional diguanylate cyclase/phosphodiesterase n=1 Tax=Alloyangia pacifica TaxID=311180 RepID=UPI001CD67CDC|nr:GGDEF domain-containing phosphodiesterase [Alloyangia pacifica]MCA0997831.1 GGDEF domain-containing phosphodiesterase [Alloyangia pacifica]